MALMPGSVCRIVPDIPGGMLRVSNDDFSAHTFAYGWEPVLILGHQMFLGEPSRVLRVLLNGTLCRLHQTWLEDGKLEDAE